MFNSKLKAKIQEKDYRIQQLEEIICPNQDHDYIIIDECNSSEYTGGGIVEVYTRRKLQCAKCKKVTYDSTRPLCRQYKARKNKQTT